MHIDKSAVQQNMEKMKIIVCGSTGKMGMLVKKIASEKKHDIVGEISRKTANIDDVFSNCDADVCIDFSTPETMVNLCEYAQKYNVPVVTGTTGISDQGMERIQKCANDIPILISSNFSIGVFVLRKIVNEAAALLPGNFDIEIIEKHHTAKKDAPSGTALSLFDEIKHARGTSRPVFGRHSEQKYATGDVGIHSVRGGNVVGEHEVYFFGNDEKLTISHIATNREIFARGVVFATEKFVSLRSKPGLYKLGDIL